MDCISSIVQGINQLPHVYFQYSGLVNGFVLKFALFAFLGLCIEVVYREIKIASKFK